MAISNELNPREQLLDIKAVSKMVCLSRSCLYSLIRSGDFMPPIKATPYCSRWRLSETKAWIDSRPRMGDD